jgi:uncharacterized RDD family membrane protein YckC
VSEERPPGDRDREPTEGDPLQAGREPAPPPPPWRRDPPAQDSSPAEQSWRPYPDEEPAEEESGNDEAQRAFGTEPAPAPEAAFGAPPPEPETQAPQEQPGLTGQPSPLDPEPAPPAPEAVPPAPEPPPPAPAPPPPAPRTGSIGPPGYESGALGGVPPGATLPPRQFEPPAPAERYVLAEWWRRAVAYLLDGLIIGVIVTLLIVIITGAAGGVGFLGGDATGYGGLLLGLLFSTLLATAVAVLYAPFYMARTNGQTLGKQVMGIRVIRPGGQPVDFLWSVLREVIIKAFLFAGLGSSITFGIAWLVDCLWPLWDNENRALHDLIVDSRVVRA